MRNAILLALAIFVLASCAFAGDDAVPKVSKGDKAWLFTLNGLSDLGAGNYNGGAGFKYYISDGTALRLSLGIGTVSTTVKYTGPSDPTRADETVSGNSFSITPGIVTNFTTNGTIVPYGGAQFSLGWSSTTDENPGFVAQHKEYDKQNLYSVAGLLGVEWFAWNSVSLGAEYHLTYLWANGTHESTVAGTTTSTDHPSTTAFSLGSASSAAFTLSVYW